MLFNNEPILKFCSVNKTQRKFIDLYCQTNEIWILFGLSETPFWSYDILNNKSEKLLLVRKNNLNTSKAVFISFLQYLFKCIQLRRQLEIINWTLSLLVATQIQINFIISNRAKPIKNALSSLVDHTENTWSNLYDIIISKCDREEIFGEKH